MFGLNTEKQIGHRCPPVSRIPTTNDEIALVLLLSRELVSFFLEKPAIEVYISHSGRTLMFSAKSKRSPAGVLFRARESRCGTC